MERYETSGGESSQQEQGETVQEIEEELAVGKRKVVSGGARVTTSVSERPVEETVTLREEQVEVEHQPADRKLKPEEAEAAFQEKTVEMLGTSEELEVSKEARVIGEVALGKRVAEHEETVKDTVRRSKVEIEKIGLVRASRSKHRGTIEALPATSGALSRHARSAGRLIGLASLVRDARCHQVGIPSMYGRNITPAVPELGGRVQK